MDERKFRILQAIIDDYILTAVPVGSRTISRKYETGLSSATIRNEMSDLEELGYLDQPHVSAGRIPSAKAYRLYVDQLLQSGQLRTGSEEDIRAYFTGRSRKMEDVIDRAAEALSQLTNYASVVLQPTGPEPRISRVQLVPITERSALVVMVTDLGVVRDTVVDTPPDVDADTLYAISRMLTEQLNGLSLREAAAKLPSLARSVRMGGEMLSGLSAALGEHEGQGKPYVRVRGASNMLSYPEYSDAEKARGLLSVLEARDQLTRIIGQRGDVAFTVRIGPETGVPEMSDCSIVTATYSTRSGRQGTLGVIGPTRMQYSRVLSVLGLMGQQLSALFGSPDGKDEDHEKT